jgi:two-component system, OmpR family, phosphate regulon sensor histidine kinase PhoR
MIYADPGYIENIMKNLLDNSFKYSLKNPEIEVKTEDVNGNMVISVKDNGIGIEKDKQKYIFDRFYRVPTGDIHNVQGSGLGLYYVKKMVEAHEGFISLTSEPGKGSCFKITLPVK